MKLRTRNLKKIIVSFIEVFKGIQEGTKTPVYVKRVEKKIAWVMYKTTQMHD